VADRVWKFVFTNPTSTGRVFVDMPASARPISVGLQGDQMVVWALCDPEQETELDMQVTGPRRFIVTNTGQEIPGFPDGGRFLGTVTSDNGIVWHVWDADARTTA
jgi:hypothetical protein